VPRHKEAQKAQSSLPWVYLIIRSIMEVDDEEIEFSDTWTEQDLQDLSTFSCSSATQGYNQP
jgi:hypothetical protein